MKSQYQIFSNIGILFSAHIHHKINVSIKTIYYSMANLQQTGSTENWCANDRLRVLNEVEKSRYIDQYIRSNSEITLRKIKGK